MLVSLAALGCEAPPSVPVEELQYRWSPDQPFVPLEQRMLGDIPPGLADESLELSFRLPETPFEDPAVFPLYVGDVGAISVGDEARQLDGSFPDYIPFTSADAGRTVVLEIENAGSPRVFSVTVRPQRALVAWRLKEESLSFIVGMFALFAAIFVGAVGVIRRAAAAQAWFSVFCFGTSVAIIRLDEGGAIRERLSAGGSPLTEAIGTPPYMPPEALSGLPTAAWDVFAFGVLAVEVFAEHLPFVRPPVLAAGAGLPLDPPDLFGVPEEHRALLAAALDFVPARRPSAADLVRGLSVTSPTRV